jgi:hypothetical protein
VNGISLTPGNTGSPGVITLQPGADANGSIQIVPNGSGDIILFGQGQTGSLVFANQSMWIPALGLTPCPAMQGGGAVPLGMTGAPVVTGYFVFEDWLDRVHYSPACG